MSSKQVAFVGLGLAVLAGLVILFIATRPGDSEAKPDVGPQSESAASNPGKAGGSRPEVASADRSQPIEDDDDQAKKPKGREYYTDDGTLVRDHRSGNPSPITTTSKLRGKVEKKVAPETVMAVRRTMRPIVHDCAGEVDEGALSDGAKLESRVMITIKDDVLKVDQVKVKVFGVEDDDLVECVRTQVAAIELPANGHPEVSREWLNYPFRLRR